MQTHARVVVILSLLTTPGKGEGLVLYS